MKSIVDLAQRVKIHIGHFEKALSVNAEFTCHALTIESARESYYAAPNYSPSQNASWREWDRLATVEVGCAKNILELKKVFHRTPKYSESRQLALEKWINFCSSPTELDEVYEKTSSGSFNQLVALEKWNQFSLILTENIVTIADAEYAYNTALSGSKAKKIALKKWQDFSIIEIEKVTTIEGARELFSQVPWEDEIQAILLKKMIAIYNEL